MWRYYPCPDHSQLAQPSKAWTTLEDSQRKSKANVAVSGMAALGCPIASSCATTQWKSVLKWVVFSRWGNFPAVHSLRRGFPVDFRYWHPVYEAEARKSHSKGIVQIVALRASDSRYRRLAILQVDSSGIEKVEPNESVASISWTSILNITQTQSANFGQASIVVMGKNGESLLDFIPMGKAGIHRLGAGRVDEFVKRIEHVRKLH